MPESLMESMAPERRHLPLYPPKVPMKAWTFKFDTEPVEVGDLVITYTTPGVEPTWHASIREGALYRVVRKPRRGIVVIDPFLEGNRYVLLDNEYYVWHPDCK